MYKLSKNYPKLSKMDNYYPFLSKMKFFWTTLFLSKKTTKKKYGNKHKY